MIDQRRRIEDALASLIHDWPDLENLHTMSGGTVTGGGNDLQLPGGTMRLHLIDEANRIVTSWCLLVLEERDLTGGNVGTDVQDRADFLMTHAGWLGAHESAADAGDELTDVSGRIRALVAPCGVRRIPVGACPALDCGGVVVAAISDSTDLAGPDLVCDVDREHTWPEGHYHRLAALLGCDGPERMTLVELRDYLDGRFGSMAPTERKVRGWVKRYPVSMGWEPFSQTVDRVSAVGVYLEHRYSRAA